MPTFSTKIRPSDLPEEVLDKVSSGSIHTIPNKNEYVLCSLNSDVQNAFPNLTKDTIRHFFTCGHWSSHELLYHILQMTGPAKVMISVWSISETAARLLIDLLENGLITELTAVLDYRSKNRHPGAYQLANHSFTKLNTMVCHAKITVIQNEQWDVTINGSANYTNNPRPEAGYVDTHKTTAEFYATYIQQMINNSNPFE